MRITKTVSGGSVMRASWAAGMSVLLCSCVPADSAGGSVEEFEVELDFTRPISDELAARTPRGLPEQLYEWVDRPQHSANSDSRITVRYVHPPRLLSDVYGIDPDDSYLFTFDPEEEWHTSAAQFGNLNNNDIYLEWPLLEVDNITDSYTQPIIMDEYRSINRKSGTVALVGGIDARYGLEEYFTNDEMRDSFARGTRPRRFIKLHIPGAWALIGGEYVGLSEDIDMDSLGQRFPDDYRGLLQEKLLKDVLSAKEGDLPAGGWYANAGSDGVYVALVSNEPARLGANMRLYMQHDGHFTNVISEMEVYT